MLGWRKENLSFLKYLVALVIFTEAIDKLEVMYISVKRVDRRYGRALRKFAFVSAVVEFKD